MVRMIKITREGDLGNGRQIKKPNEIIQKKGVLLLSWVLRLKYEDTQIEIRMGSQYNRRFTAKELYTHGDDEPLADMIRLKKYDTAKNVFVIGFNATTPVLCNELYLSLRPDNGVTDEEYRYEYMSVFPTGAAPRAEVPSIPEMKVPEIELTLPEREMSLDEFLSGLPDQVEPFFRFILQARRGG